MKPSVLVVCLSTAIWSASGLSPPVSQINCKPQEKWITERIEYECYNRSDTAGFQIGYRPIFCVTDNNVRKKPGDSWKDDYFKYECKMEAEKMIYAIVACFTPIGTEFAPGTTINQDGGFYGCVRLDDGSLSRTFSKETTCLYKNQRYEQGKTWKEGDVTLICALDAGKLIAKADSCITSTGVVVKINSISSLPDGTVIKCIVDAKDKLKATLETIDSNCTDANGVQRAVGTKWDLEEFQYECKVYGVNPKVERINCIYNVSKPVQKLYIGLEQAGLARSGVWYWCKKEGTGNATTYVVVPLNGTQTTCTFKGKTYNLTNQWNETNIRYRCSWRNRAYVEQQGCLTPDKKNLNRNDIREITNGTAFKCEGGANGTVVWRQLSWEEYRVWKLQQNANVTGKQFQGSGNETQFLCDAGYRYIDGRCTDVDECAQGIAQCSVNETCTNRLGSYDCDCKPGFERDGTSCEDIDECGTGAAKCGANEVCSNNQGSFRCDCIKGHFRTPLGVCTPAEICDCLRITIRG